MEHTDDPETNVHTTSDYKTRFISYKWSGTGEASSTIFPANSTLQFQLRIDSSSGLFLTLVGGARKIEARYSTSGNTSTGQNNKKRKGFGTVRFSQQNHEVRLTFDAETSVNGTRTGFRYQSQDGLNFTIVLELFIVREDPVVENPSCDLVADLKTALDSDSNKELNDITMLAGPDKVVVKANKFMLCARSRVFYANLHSEMKENSSNEIELPEFDPDVCQEMITYINTDETPNISSLAEKVWHIAHMYELPGLQARCENILAKQLTVQNAGHLLAFADTYYCGDGELREYVLSFITSDNETCSEVVDSDTWDEVEDQPDLRYEVFLRLLDCEREPPAKKVCNEVEL